MRIIFLVVGVIFSYGVVLAQNDPSVQNFENFTKVYPPAPQAAALAKYAEIPVNHHTGIPQIGVPIYSWKSKRGNASFDVSLSYHAGGIKVEDITTNIGTGWTLSSGGVITRTVRGLPDEHIFGFINTPQIPHYNTSLYNGSYYLNHYILSNEKQMDDTSRLKILAYFNDPGNNQTYMENWFTGFWDTEQDLFYYNVGGYSGKFVIGKDGVVYKIDTNPIEIIRLTDMRFIIQADNGIRYFFDGLRELSFTKNYTAAVNYSYDATATSAVSFAPIQENYGNEHFSTWQVAKAVDLNSSDTIFFDYHQREIKFVNGWNENLEFHENNDPGGSTCSHFNGPSFKCEAFTAGKINFRAESYVYNRVQTYHLSQVRLPDGGKVKFYYDDARIDLDGDSVLTRIEILDNAGNSKKFRMRHSYFDSRLVTGPDIATWCSNNQVVPSEYSHINADHLVSRLKLENVQQVTDWVGDSLMLYRFEYNDTLLPPRSCKAIDFWGYYVGNKRLAYTLVPQIATPNADDNWPGDVVPMAGPDGDIYNAFNEGADRTPDAKFARAGILKKIWLPTGGYTQFYFETNSVPEPIYANSHTAYVDANKVRANINTSQPIAFDGRVNEKVVFQIYFKRINYDGSLFVYTPPDPNQPQTCFGDIVENSYITLHVVSSDGIIHKQYPFYGIREGNSQTGVYLELPTGKQYSFYYTFNPNNDPCLNDVYFEFSTRAAFTINNTNILVGGLRVAMVDHYDPIALKRLKTLYDYRNDDNNISGVIPQIPNLNFYVHAIGKWDVCQGGGMPQFLGYNKLRARTSASTQTLGYSFGGNIGYLKVTQRQADQNNLSLGKIIYRFTGPDIRNKHTIYPYKTNQVADWNSGHKWQEAIYNSDNVLQKRISYTYSVNEGIYYNANNRSVRIACIRTDDCAGADPFKYQRFVATEFFPHYGRNFLVQKREADFLGTDSLIAVTNYSYNNASDYLTSITTSENSKGYATTVSFTYPENYSYAGMQQLVMNRVKNMPVGSRTTQHKFNSGQTIIHEIKGEGVDYAAYGGYARPTKFSSLATNNATTLSTPTVYSVKRGTDIITGEILQYDHYGNAVEMKGRDGIIQTILWGYNYTMPVAKIIGAGYNDVLSKLSSTTYVGIQTITDEIVLRSKINEIRNGYATNKHVMVTGTTYKPLIGATSETDGNNNTIYYEYDGFGRVILVRDKDQNIVKKFCYTYIGQQTDCSEIIAATTPPANCNQCTSSKNKCINNVCETGVRICVSTVRTGSNTWTNSFYYQWSDGSRSAQIIALNEPFPCVDID